MRPRKAGFARVFVSVGASACLVAASASAEPASPEGSASVVAFASDGSLIEPSTDHLAISRELPQSLAAAASPLDADAVRLVFAGLGSRPAGIRVSTRRVDGTPLDVLVDPALSAVPCPPPIGPGPCWSTLPLRLTLDRLDRDYAGARERSLESELGGFLRAEGAGKVLQSFRVGGPRSSAFAGLDRLSAKLRVRIVRVSPGGAPAIGTDNASARGIARAEIMAAGKLWAQCGIDLTSAGALDIEVVDPPPTELVAIGCDAGLPASGGFVNLDVLRHRLHVPSRAGEAPLLVAQHVARALRGAGLGVQLSSNQRTSAGAAGAVDLLVRNAQGGAVSVSADPGAPLSTDPTLNVCLGEVDLGNGLSHFVESDALAGTLEERALIKAFDDGDPTTIEVFIVPSFDQSGRIGESFIDDDGSGIQNTVIIDRAALRAGPRSYALAHELGHIFLEMPGHPDDYGVDQSSSLMDADASDASVFGPRRLSLAECERVVRESGPKGRVPLLQAWPLPPPSPVTSGR